MAELSLLATTALAATLPAALSTTATASLATTATATFALLTPDLASAGLTATLA